MSFSPIDLFDLVVAENGALLYRPQDRTTTLAASEFLAASSPN
jgi:hypothetical protein